MLRTQAIDVINSRRAWAFLGAGVTEDAGGPSWRGLLDDVVRQLGLGEGVAAEALFQRAYAQRHYAKCFSVIERLAGRAKLEGAVGERLKAVQAPGTLHKLLADLPFRGYMTTNYDMLIEDALALSGTRGWVPVGNTREELRKVAGDPDSGLVWHIHGFLPRRDAESTRSRLVLTAEDYDSIYLEESLAISQLRGLLTHARIVFVGFGFGDPEFERILKRVGSLASPDRPLFAFFPFESDGIPESTREEYLLRYNTDLIPYRVVDGSHKNLLPLLETYSALCVRRSIAYGSKSPTRPAFDPETTGLLIYNELCLRNRDAPSVEVRRSILRSSLLAALRSGAPQTTEALAADLAPRIALFGPTRPNITQDVEEAARDLVRERLLQASRAEGGVPPSYSLTDEAERIVGAQRAVSSLLRDQFQSSIDTRAAEMCKEAGGDAGRVAAAAVAFLDHCVATRALGVALAFGDGGGRNQYHMVALLQELPRFMERVSSPEEAIALSKVVRSLFARPSLAERRFIGVSLQARFVVHLLGYDENTLKIRSAQLQNAVFLVDSSTLIPYLAKSCIGHDAARALIDRLRAIGCALVATPLLATEVAEHARYALAKVDADTGSPTHATIRAVGGSGGEKSNAFLDGFLREIADGAPPNLRDYLHRSCGIPLRGASCSDSTVEEALLTTGVPVRAFQSWAGFTPLLWASRDELRDQIAAKRRALGSYTHDRQAEAEAEAVLVVRGLRDGQLSIPDRRISSAFFISKSRVVDDVVRPLAPVTIRPEGVAHWVATISACTVDDLSFLIDRLMWELSEHEISIVDPRLLRSAFGPMIDASHDRLAVELERHKDLIAERFGEGAERAFAAAGEYDYPLLEDAYFVQVAEGLRGELQVERERKLAAERRATLTDKDRKRLDALEGAERLRQTKLKTRKRKRDAKKRRSKGRKH